jgi:hypothetical protein
MHSLLPIQVWTQLLVLAEAGIDDHTAAVTGNAFTAAGAGVGRAADAAC